ncbi:MAG: NADH-quinone oxidoreductase subunit NuoK [bacterium]
MPIEPFYLQANLLLAVFIFAVGIVGFLFKRSAISLFMCIELMLNAANLAFVTFASHQAFWLHNPEAALDGGIFVLFIITIAAAEAGVGLAIFISLFRRQQNINVDEMVSLQG